MNKTHKYTSNFRTVEYKPLKPEWFRKLLLILLLPFVLIEIARWRKKDPYSLRNHWQAFKTVWQLKGVEGKK